MSAIIWDEESRQFSVVEDQRNYTFDPKAEWNKYHPAKPKNSPAGTKLYKFGKDATRNAVIGGAVTSVVGGLSGRAIARSKARAAGASEEEIAAAGRKGALVGAGLGAATGAGIGYGASKYAKSLGSKKLNHLNQKGDAGKEARKIHNERKKLHDEMNKIGPKTKAMYKMIEKKQGAKAAQDWLKRRGDMRMMSLFE